MANLPSGLVTHSKKVCNFYKRVLRHLDSSYHLPEYRYEATVMRARFEENKNIPDLRVAKDLLRKGEEQLLRECHYQYKKFALSPGGCAYERDHVAPDWLLDYWHPMEKAMYPKYFALREKRKKEYEEFYKKEYGVAPSDSTSGHH